MSIVISDDTKTTKILHYKGQKILIDTKDIPLLSGLLKDSLLPVDVMEGELYQLYERSGRYCYG